MVIGINKRACLLLGIFITNILFVHAMDKEFHMGLEAQVARFFSPQSFRVEVDLSTEVLNRVPYRDMVGRTDLTGTGYPPEDRNFTSTFFRSNMHLQDKPYSCIVAGSAPPPSKPPFHLLERDRTNWLIKDMGKPESLKLNLQDLLSRRINEEHRLIAEQDDSLECMPNKPDEILAMFLMFLPTKDYIQSSRASKRFYRIAHDKQVLIAHFEHITHNPFLLERYIQSEDIAKRFNSLWLIASNLEQREEEVQAFEDDFKDEVRVLWKETKFHSSMLRKEPFDYDTILLRSSTYNILNNLLEIDSILNLHSSKESTIDTKFSVYIRTFIPQLNQAQLTRCKGDLWKYLPQRQFNIQLPPAQFNLENFLVLEGAQFLQPIQLTLENFLILEGEEIQDKGLN